MSLDHFINEALSPWMREEGPDGDIVMSSRIRLARNFSDYVFPIIADESELQMAANFVQGEFANKSFESYEDFEFVPMAELSSIEKRMLIEKHLISPVLLKHTDTSAMLISKNEQASIMVNEEDHIRLQLYFPGFQLKKALEEAFKLDDWLEQKIDYAYDEKWGYLSSCPTNTGTGMRASVMMHLPGLVITQQMSRLIPAINQLGLVVRGLYGEGSEARGNIFQISNQITMGKSEGDIVSDLESIVRQLIDHERKARRHLQEQSGMRLEDRIFRSYGVLSHSRILDSKEAAKCLSDVRLGIDLKIIKEISGQILNELMILTQPGFLQHYAKGAVAAENRDILRAELVRERLQMEN